MVGQVAELNMVYQYYKNEILFTIYDNDTQSDPNYILNSQPEKKYVQSKIQFNSNVKQVAISKID